MFLTFYLFVVVSVIRGQRTTDGGPPVSPQSQYFWPHGQIYYTIDSSFDSTDRTNLNRAIADYHNKTCIRWIPRVTQEDFVTFRRVATGCAESSNCYRYEGHELHSSYGMCTSSDTMIHEMGHLLCFGHEYARNDRDTYIYNLPGCHQNEKFEHINFGHLYDYTSIMHKGMITACSKMDGVTQMGNNDGLSVLDAEKLNDTYNCKECFSYRFRAPSAITSNDNPVVGGRDLGKKLVLYPCRAYNNGDIVPGKGVLEGSPVCFVSNGGLEYELRSDFEILTNPGKANFRWIASTGSIPEGAIAGGRTASGETLYIAKCTVPGRVTPGKLRQSESNVMYYGYGGVEVACSQFDVLVC